ncbi:MAG TPA: helix-turn-helix domain-containing protein [Blastocatellia bacterium]|jgi:excisionase family DNA binding protein|nr:helix-turn-helix domain-containing protein [Blastocatellia bacterium]
MQNRERTEDSPIEAARKSPPVKLAFRPAEAAQATGVSEMYIRTLLGRGQIKAKKAGKITLILATALNEWLESLSDLEQGHKRS